MSDSEHKEKPPQEKTQHKVPFVCKLGAVLIIAVALCFYFYRWNWRPLTYEDKLECYGQVCVDGYMIGSGFFLEDISGFKRAYYFVTNEHVRRGAMELSQRSGSPILLRFKSGNSDRAAILSLGTDAFQRFQNTDIVSIPIYAPMVNRVLFGAGYRYVALDRDVIEGKKSPSKGRIYLIPSARYSEAGVTNHASTLTYHHIPEPGSTAQMLNLWTNTVRQAEGYVLSMPVMDRPFYEYQSTPLFRLFSPVIPGDSGSLVTHEEDGISYAVAVIQGLPGSGPVQNGPPWAIPSDVVISSIDPPTIGTTFGAICRVAWLFVLAYFLISWGLGKLVDFVKKKRLGV